VSKVPEKGPNLPAGDAEKKKKRVYSITFKVCCSRSNRTFAAKKKGQEEWLGIVCVCGLDYQQSVFPKILRLIPRGEKNEENLSAEKKKR